MRKHYVDDLNFLSSTYKQAEIEVFSTIMDRAQVSAISLVVGLYDGTGPSLPKDIDPSLLVPPYKYSDDVGGESALPHQFQPVPVREGRIMTQCSKNEELQEKNLAESRSIV